MVVVVNRMQRPRLFKAFTSPSLPHMGDYMLSFDDDCGPSQSVEVGGEKASQDTFLNKACIAFDATHMHVPELNDAMNIVHQLACKLVDTE